VTVFEMAQAFHRLPHEVLGMDAEDYFFALSCCEAAQDARSQSEMAEKHRKLRTGN